MILCPVSSFPDGRYIQRHTRELLFISVSRFHALALVPATISLPEEDLQKLLLELLSWIKPFVHAGTPINTGFPKAFRAYLASHPRTSHPVLPFIYFCTCLARSDEKAALLLLDLGLIECLRDMCVHDFPSPSENVVYISSRTDAIPQSDVYASLTLLLAALAAHPSCASRILRKPDLPPWILSIYYASDFIGFPTSSFLQDAWLLLEPHITRMILVSLECTVKGGGLQGRSAVPDDRSLPLERVYCDLFATIRYVRPSFGHESPLFSNYVYQRPFMYSRTTVQRNRYVSLLREVRGQ
ncbi:hypothetical protein BDW22DRAFT_1361658 [Trametopsis cervina]|nr:hypothetical protein BDW22DRAFT_1361658 [Trametopsis cervina]